MVWVTTDVGMGDSYWVVPPFLTRLLAWKRQVTKAAQSISPNLNHSMSSYIKSSSWVVSQVGLGFGLSGCWWFPPLTISCQVQQKLMLCRVANNLQQPRQKAKSGLDSQLAWVRVGSCWIVNIYLLSVCYEVHTPKLGAAVSPLLDGLFSLFLFL